MLTEPEETAEIPNLAAIRAADVAIQPYCLHTPLLPLQAHQGDAEIFLKLENLQNLGVFKIRSIANLLLNTHAEYLTLGVYTASSGNAGLTVAWMARQLNIPARIYAPEGSPSVKLAAIQRYGAEVRLMDAQAWWNIIENNGYPADPGYYVDAVRNPLALAGNATIGLEIAAQLPDLDTVIVPFGGGGLSCGIAAALRALKPRVRIIVAESSAATPLTSAFKAGEPVKVTVADSFISGAGASNVLAEMWPRVQTLINETFVVPVSVVAATIRHLHEHNHIVVEGAGALAVAAAMMGAGGAGKTVCVVSGGNIATEQIAGMLG